MSSLVSILDIVILKLPVMHQIPEGTGISIATWGFHHDPQYFPDPEKFDPERFSEQNKHNIKPFTYMPFGLGPRNCIGKIYIKLICTVKSS